MKALTIWQPWALLIAIGEKKFETRSWRPQSALIGKRIAIHAANRQPLYEEKLLLSTVTGGVPFTHPLVLGAVIATAVLERVYQTSDSIFLDQNFDKERVLGDFSKGRFAWSLKEVELIYPPIPARGKQRLWSFESDRLALREAEVGVIREGTSCGTG